jgi:hypothetical protein
MSIALRFDETMATTSQWVTTSWIMMLRLW